jgi:hypothetical protein
MDARRLGIGTDRLNMGREGLSTDIALCRSYQAKRSCNV